MTMMMIPLLHFFFSCKLFCCPLVFCFCQILFLCSEYNLQKDKDLIFFLSVFNLVGREKTQRTANGPLSLESNNIMRL